VKTGFLSGDDEKKSVSQSRRGGCHGKPELDPGYRQDKGNLSFRDVWYTARNRSSMGRTETGVGGREKEQGEMRKQILEMGGTPTDAYRWDRASLLKLDVRGGKLPGMRRMPSSGKDKGTSGHMVRGRESR